MTARGLSKRATLIAVVTAFVVGMLGSLALRPHSITGERNLGAGTGQTQSRISWRVPVVFQTNLPVLGDNPVYVAAQVNAASGGGIQFRLYEPGEVVPAFSITDAVRDNKVEAGYTWLGYDQGKIPASALLAAVPFGMEPWEYSAWWYEAGGRELAEGLYARHNIHLIYCGMTGPETAGWFRKRIETLEDVRGLKIRFAGIGGKVIEQLGASVTMLPGGEIFQALIDTACTACVTRNLARSEGLQGAVMVGFSAKGVIAETLPMVLLREFESVTNTVLEAEARTDAYFARILESQRRFREEYANWKSKAYLPRHF